MRKPLVLLITVALAFSASAAMAALTWDFEDGMQGWTWSTAHAQSVPGQWIAPGPPPEIIPGQGIYGVGGGNLFCPGDANSRATAEFDLSSMLVGGKTSRFFLQADVYIPNLRPLTGFPNDYPGNMNQFSGIYALSATSTWGVAMYGRPDKGSQCFTDYTADDSWPERRQDWYMEDWTGGSYVQPDSLWWNTWITLQVDFGFTTPGQVTVKYNIPWTTYDGKTGWITLYSGAIYPNSWGPGLRDFSRIAIGSNLSTAGTPWSKSQYDNIIFDSPDLVPEPGSFFALGAGLIGLGGLIRRRRA